VLKRRISLLALVSLTVLATNGCDGNSGTKATSGVAGSKLMSNLTDEDVKKLCDWSASLYGGYGKVTSCTDWTVGAPKDVATCLARSESIQANCTLSVEEAEACMKGVAACNPDPVLCAELLSCYSAIDPFST
jgi:hypothetical protein